MSPEDTFIAHRGLIERLIQHACRRCHFRREDCEDFGSIVNIKLIEDDYAVFREFKGKSKLETYLNTVVQHQLLDHLDHLWGKWRASAEAERLGPVAVKLEQLWRDGYSIDEACEVLRTNDRVQESLAELARIAARLPPRVRRRVEGEEQLVTVPSPDRSPEERLRAKERAATRARVRDALRKALADLPKEDRGLIKMWARMPVSQIARSCGIEQKPLYPRFERIFKKLRRAVEQEGVTDDDIRDILSKE
jgi:RNA polymerase sigma factor (sigma-70 family)